MKFYLFSSVLLLASLVMAEQPTTKILYDSDFVIAETTDFPEMTFYYAHDVLYNGGGLNFTTTSNNTRHFYETMQIKNGFEEQTSEFAIEVYSKYEAGYNPDLDRFCIDRSSEALRGLIKKCYARTLLREMSSDEKKQMKEYKEEHRRTLNRVKVVYAQNEKIKIKVPDNSHDVSIKSYIFQNGASSANRSIQFESFCKPIDAPRYSPGIAMYFLKQWLPNNFVIEGLSIGSYVDCFQTEFRGLEPYACGGDLIFRRLTKDD